MVEPAPVKRVVEGSNPSFPALEHFSIFKESSSETYIEAMVESGYVTNRKIARQLASQGKVWLYYTIEVGDGRLRLVYEVLSSVDEVISFDRPFLLVFGARRFCVRLV